MQATDAGVRHAWFGYFFEGKWFVEIENKEKTNTFNQLKLNHFSEESS